MTGEVAARLVGDDSERVARIVGLAGTVVDMIIRRTETSEAGRQETPGRDARVWLLSRDLHRAIDAAPEDLMLFMAELATRYVEKCEAPR